VTESRVNDFPGIILDSRSEFDTVSIGRALGTVLRVGDVVLLSGELGSGKTRIVKGISEGIGSPHLARSPTFVLMVQYTGRITLFHCDFYRLSSDLETEDLALDEAIEQGAIAIEWPDIAPENIRKDALLMTIQTDFEESIRCISINASGPRSEELLTLFAATLRTLPEIYTPMVENR